MMEPNGHVARKRFETYSRADQMVFTGAITPHSTRSGELVTSLGQLDEYPKESVQFSSLLANIQMEQAIAQAWQVYEVLSGWLSREGAALGDVLRQRVFLTDVRDLPAVERVMDVVFGDDKPATNVIIVHRNGVDLGLSLWLDAIALVPLAGGTTKSVVRIPELNAATRGFPQATRAGDLIFTSGIAGIPTAEENPARSIESLGAEAVGHLELDVPGGVEEALTAETWVIFKNLEAILATQGATLSDLLKVNGWLTCDMRGYRFSSLAREALFADERMVPASSGLSIEGLPWQRSNAAFDAIASVPNTPGAKQIRVPVHGIVRTYVSATASGPMVFSAGEVPISVSEASGAAHATLIDSDVDLPDDGRLLSFGRVHQTDFYGVRAWYVYRQLSDYLSAYGSSLADVVHQTIYLYDPTQFPDVERVASLFYGATLPPTTVIPINDTSPFRQANLEIEVITHEDKA